MSSYTDSWEVAYTQARRFVSVELDQFLNMMLVHGFALPALFAQSAHFAHFAQSAALLLCQGVTPPVETLSLHDAQVSEYANSEPFHPALAFQWSRRSDRASPTRKGTSACRRHITGGSWSVSSPASRSVPTYSRDGSGLRLLLPKV